MMALRLFAADGYEAVSVSAIAGAMGMTKGALYKHYKNKRDIFDCIVKRMFEIDAQRAQAFELPKDAFTDVPEAYGDISIDHMKRFTLAQLTFWTEDDFASQFRKMLTLEQYRSSEMAKLYADCLVAGPVGYMEDIFRELMANGILKKGDPKQLAVVYYAPLFLLISMADGSIDKDLATQLLNRHIEEFMSTMSLKTI